MTSQAINREDQSASRRLYVLVRLDLPWPQRAVQAAHAAASLAFSLRDRIGEETWGVHGPAFIFFGVSGERELEQWGDLLGPAGIGFREPDLAGQLTAFAYLGHRRPEFAGLRLL